jgi:hypothetical protein
MAEMILFVLSDMVTEQWLSSSYIPWYGGREPTGGGREHFNTEDFSWPFFLCTLGLILVAGALALFPLAAFLNWYDTHRRGRAISGWVCAFNIPDRRTRYLSAQWSSGSVDQWWKVLPRRSRGQTRAT